MAFFTDTHCHLNLPPLSDRLEIIIKNAEEKGVRRILVPGLDAESSKSALALQKQFPKRVYAAAGIHPNYASDASEEDFLEIERTVSEEKINAVGEIGLDFFRDFSPRNVQISVFRKMLEIAKIHCLPICVHNRDSDLEIIQILDDWVRDLHQENNPLANLPGVFHSYNGSEIISKFAVENNFFLGISGPITFSKSEQIRKMVAEIDLNHLLIETDAPYLTPVPYRGKKNEPAYVVYIAEEIARIKDIDFGQVADITSENARRLFNWD